MKNPAIRIIAALFALMLTASAHATDSSYEGGYTPLKPLGTDYNCVNRCSQAGSTYSYCQSACSYPDTPQQPHQVDYACVNRCTAQGNTYQYCQSACSY